MAQVISNMGMRCNRKTFMTERFAATIRSHVNSVSNIRKKTLIIRYCLVNISPKLRRFNAGPPLRFAEGPYRPKFANTASLPPFVAGRPRFRQLLVERRPSVTSDGNQYGKSRWQATKFAFICGGPLLN